jgi:hypothetical protein
MCSTFVAFVYPLSDNYETNRYHQHLEAQEKEACNHTDGSFCTHLPLVSINTGGQEIPGRAYDDEEGNTVYTVTEDGADFIRGSISVVENRNTNNHCSDTPSLVCDMEINVRGNTSRKFKKVGYGIRLVDSDGFNLDASMMGMDAHHEWVLHGPILDASLIRNYICYNMAGETMEYAPNVRFCEVFINDEYMGLYLMSESVTAGDTDTRLNLSVSKKNNTFLGYCLRLDRGSSTEIKNLDVFSMYAYKHFGTLNLEYPGTKNITEILKENIEKDFSAFERALYNSSESNRSWKNMVDMESFADYFIINEFTSNYDAGLYSTYIYKDMDGVFKLCTWDFNSAFDNYQDHVVSPEGFTLQNRLWFDKMFTDKEFVELVIERYYKLRESLLSEEYLFEYIDSTVSFLGESVYRNTERWEDAYVGGLLIPIDRNPESHDEAISNMKDFIKERGTWMDENIESLRQHINNN